MPWSCRADTRTFTSRRRTAGSSNRGFTCSSRRRRSSSASAGIGSSRMPTQRSPLYGHFGARRGVAAAASAAILLLASASASAQGGAPLTERFFGIEQSAPGLEELIKPSAEWELIGDRYGLTEGPVWVDDAGGAGNPGGGYLLFADLISNVIYKWQIGRA